MSDEVKNAKLDWPAIQEIEKKKVELQAKKNKLDERKYDSQLARLEQSDKDLEIAKKTNFGALSQEHIDKIKSDNLSYIAGAKDAMVFINPVFAGMVPFFRKNLILVGARTGGGKSTAVANIAFEILRQVNPATGERRKICVITNEEKSEDFYNRETCLGRGWHYVNHDKFSAEMVTAFTQGIDVLTKNGTLIVIDDTFNGSSGLTKTIEGMKIIFESLLRDKIYYDAVLIDYYQNVSTSTADPSLTQYQVQEQFAKLLDWFKNEYPAPIVLMAQVNPDNKDDSKSFESRVKGAKMISDKCTFTMEMIRNKKDLCTEWLVHKSRFTEALGNSFITGYEKGRFVDYTEDFQLKVAKLREKEEHAKIMGAVFKEEKKEESNE